MAEHSLVSLIAPEQRIRWHEVQPRVWSLTAGAPQVAPAQSILQTLFDQPRWLEAHHLYDEKGSALFERICELPEYYLTRTENAILERNAARIIAAAPVTALVELGAGYAKKTIHLLKQQVLQRRSGIFAPIDVSQPGLVAARDFTAANFPEISFHGLQALYEDGFASVAKEIPTLFIFLGSTLGNFRPPAFIRFFAQLAEAMGSDDYLLLGADRIKDSRILEAAYADSQGVTAQFILNVFHNINRVTGSNFDTGKMRYHSRYDSEWAQIQMYAVATETREIRFPSYGEAFLWAEGERILVEISRKFDPLRLQQQLGFFGLTPLEHFTDAEGLFSLLLFRKSS